MRILITNDDGIDAPGLTALRRIAETLSDDVWTVAPEVNHSGAGHSLSLREPLRMRQIADREYAVRGTPTDCVIMGVRHVLYDHRPDLILSGVNMGQNMAEDVTYSGTIAGAFEGTLVGVRSIALSQSIGIGGPPGAKRGPDWETCVAHGPDIVRRLLDLKWSENTLMNVNFPDCAPDEVQGIQITRQGRRDQEVLRIEERHDTWNTPYYWLGFRSRRSNAPEGTDLRAVYDGYISVTPLSLNLTADDMLEPVRQAFTTG
jgi:5'-nucleotidase